MACIAWREDRADGPPAGRRSWAARIHRRTFLGQLLATGLPLWTAPASWGAKRPPRKGAPAHPLASFDQTMQEFMRQRHVPGGALAVVKQGRLVYARGYGWADREAKEPVQAQSLFRIASISKPITGVAVLRLVEAGKLEMDAPALDFVEVEPFLLPGKEPDGRLRKVTIRQLLQHTGGWDLEKSGDPMFRAVEIAEALGKPPPANAVEVIRYMLGQPLDFDPGTSHVYSNFGYCLLGRVIEKATGRSYGTAVREAVLAPINIQQMRLGASLSDGRAPGEVRYYTAKNSLAPSVFPGQPAKVPWPYGGFHLEAMDAHGGWLASVVDLARFAAALDQPDHSPLLKPESFRTMYAPPPAPVARKPDGAVESAYYGCGWAVRPVRNQGKANYWHTGSLPGTFSLLVRRWDGLSWGALFNQRSERRTYPDTALDPALHRAADAVKAWPDTDLFPQF